MNDQEMVLKALRISAGAQVLGTFVEGSSEPSLGCQMGRNIEPPKEAERKRQALDMAPPNPECHCLKSLKLSLGCCGGSAVQLAMR